MHAAACASTVLRICVLHNTLLRDSMFCEYIKRCDQSPRVSPMVVTCPCMKDEFVNALEK